MPAAPIDRAAWASLISALIQQETGGNKTQFSNVVGVDRKTINRWLAGEVAVSEESVRAVARALGMTAGAILLKLGYYTAEDMPSEPAVARAVAEDDAAIKAVRESDAPPSLKRELIEHIMRQRAEHEQQRLAEVQRMLDLARRSRKRAG